MEAAKSLYFDTMLRLTSALVPVEELWLANFGIVRQQVGATLADKLTTCDRTEKLTDAEWEKIEADLGRYVAQHREQLRRHIPPLATTLQNYLPANTNSADPLQAYIAAKVAARAQLCPTANDNHTGSYDLTLALEPYRFHEYATIHINDELSIDANSKAQLLSISEDCTALFGNKFPGLIVTLDKFWRSKRKTSEIVAKLIDPAFKLPRKEYEEVSHILVRYVDALANCQKLYYLASRICLPTKLSFSRREIQLYELIQDIQQIYPDENLTTVLRDTTSPICHKVLAAFLLYTMWSAPILEKLPVAISEKERKKHRAA